MGVKAAILGLVLAITPSNGGMLSGSQITIDNQAGDQFDPHVDQDVAVYSSALDTLSEGLTQEIRYYDFSTNQVLPIPNALPGGGFANDLLSDVDQRRIVFTRVFPGDRTATMLFDVNTQVVTELAPMATSSRIGTAIGGQTVAFVDYSFTGNGNGEIMVLDLATNVVSRLTSDQVFDANPAVSPDGNVVTWERCVSAANCDIYAALRSGSSWVVQAVATSILNERSPDTNGTEIVFERDDLSGPTGSNIVVVPVGGGAETVLEISGEEYNPSIRGPLVLFEHRVGPANPDLYVVNLPANTMYQVTSTPTLAESLNDVDVLTNGQLRIVWKSVSETDLLNGNIFATTITAPQNSNCPFVCTHFPCPCPVVWDVFEWDNADWR